MNATKENKAPHATCKICQQNYKRSHLVLGALLRPKIFELIANEHPGFTADDWICRNDLKRFRSDYVKSLLEDEKGSITQLEEDVIKSLASHELLSEDISEVYDDRVTFANRVSDKIASFGGSWPFILSFFGFIILWICFNIVHFLQQPFDPYPFILLNLVLSCLASIQAPIIMMSQNRQETKDRIRSEHDYKVNLKAELEIRQLHEKIDHVLIQQWERLTEIQQVQIELLEDLNRNK